MRGPPGQRTTDLEKRSMNGQADPRDERDVGDDAAQGNDSGPEGDALGTAEALARENWDRYLRAAAETENVRKRSARDVENARRYALENFSRELLAVKDSLEMGIQAAASADVGSLLEGKEATLKLLSSTLERFGVEEVNPHGAPFDPEYHEAITMQPAADAEPGTVLSVVQKGYVLNGRLLRPAMVIVAADPTGR